MITRVQTLLLLHLLAAPLFAQLHGTVTDPSGASVPDALVQVRGPAGERRAKTDVNGVYEVTGIKPGTYTVRVIAKGFTVTQKPNVDISQPLAMDVQLIIAAEAQVLNVEE